MGNDRIARFSGTTGSFLLIIFENYINLCEDIHNKEKFQLHFRDDIFQRLLRHIFSTFAT